MSVIPACREGLGVLSAQHYPLEFALQQSRCRSKPWVLGLKGRV